MWFVVFEKSSPFERLAVRAGCGGDIMFFEKREDAQRRFVPA